MSRLTRKLQSLAGYSCEYIYYGGNGTDPGTDARRNVMSFRAIGAWLCGGLLMLTASSAFAAINLNSSRSNIYRSNCVKAGGKIVTDQNGKATCSKPIKQP